nr:zinc finger, CCHC-type [Tanacetum cinerariifolium]
MAGNTVKEMTTNFGKLDKFEGNDFRRWKKKMHFLLTTLKVVYVLTTPMPELVEDATVEAIRIRAKWENDDYICRGHILNGMSDFLFDVYTNVKSAKELWDLLESKFMVEDSSSKKFLMPPSWMDFKHTLKHGKDDFSLVQLGSYLRIEKSLRVQNSDKGKGKEVGRPFVNMTEEGKNKQNKGTKRSNKNNSSSSSNKKPKLECWKCGKTGHFKRDCRSGKKQRKCWWLMQLRGGSHVCKDRCWFKTFEPVKDGSVLYMGDEHFAPVHGKGSVALEFSSRKTITLFNVLYAPKLHKNLVSGPVLNKCRYKQVYESDKYILSKCSVFVGFGYYNNGMFMLNLNKVPSDSDSVYMSSSSTVVNTSLWHARLGYVHYKRMLEMSKDDLISAIDENPKIYYLFCYGYLLHAKDEALDKFRIYKTVVELQQNDLIKTSRIDRGGEYYDPVFFQSLGIIHETTAPYTPQQNGVAKSKNRALKEMIKSMLSYLGCRAVVRLPDQKRKTLGEKDIDCILVGYAEHFKAYRQKEGIDYFDTYAPVARITTIRLMLALTAIHDLVIHQMDVKTAFLNGDLDEEVYMKQPKGFVMPGNEHKILSSRFSMKDMGEADVILCIKIKRENKGIVITQSYYIEKILKKFNREDCSPVSTLMDPVEKLKPNTRKSVDQLEYSRAIGCLMYDMTSTRSYIAYAVGGLSRFTSNPSRQHWKAITRVFKYLRGTKDYGLSYVGYPLVLEGYSDARWINYVKDLSSMSGWVFLLGGGVISRASKKQTCITGSTMESEFVALAAVGKEAKWLRNFIHEISI